MRKSKVLEKIRSGRVAWTTGVSEGASTMLPGLAAGVGFDGVWIDREHRDFTYREVSAMILAVREQGADPIVRCRRSGPDALYRPLEMGAAGLIIPHCMGASHAREIVRHTRFYPVGLRGMETVCLDADYMLADPREFFAHANRETFIIVQIEDREAVDEVEEIAAIEGIDGLFLGPGDLSQSYGVPMQFDHPVMKQATEKIASAAHKHKKIFATTVGTAEAAKPFIEMGARLINVGSSIGILHCAWLQLREELEKLAREMGV